MPCSLTSKVSSTASGVVSATDVPHLTTAVSYADWLLGDLRDLERLGLLGLVRVLRAGVHLQLLEHLAAETVLREHPPHGLLDRAARVLLEELAERGRG